VVLRFESALPSRLRISANKDRNDSASHSIVEEGWTSRVLQDIHVKAIGASARSSERRLQVPVLDGSRRGAPKVVFIRGAGIKADTSKTSTETSRSRDGDVGIDVEGQYVVVHKSCQTA